MSASGGTPGSASGACVPSAPSTGQSYSAAPSDQSATIQALIDTAGAAYLAGTAGSARAVILPNGVFYGSFKMRPGVILKGQGWATILRAMPGQTAAVIDYATYDAYHTQVKDLRVDGNYEAGRTDGVAQGACRGIDMSSSGGDAYALPFPQAANSTDWPPPFASPYGWNPATLAGKWDNPCNVIDDVSVTGCGGDVAVYIGTNQRGTTAQRLVIESCKAIALQVACPDSDFGFISAGTCGDGIVVTGSSNKFTNCKSWYHGVLVGYTTGSGDGYRIRRAGADNFGGNQFFACESQDNSRYGWVVAGGRANVIRGTSGGDTGAVLLGGSGEQVNNNDIELTVSYADRQQEATGVTIDATASVYPTLNRVRLVADPLSKQAGYSPVVLTNGGVLISNSVEVAGGFGPGATGTPIGSGTWNFDPASTSIQYKVANGALQVGPAVSNTGFRQEMTLVVAQDATGGHPITFDASILGCPAASTVANKRSAYRLVNISTGNAAPSWWCVGSNIGF